MIYTDNTVISYFLPIIVSGLDAAGYTDVPVVQSNQPTQQGIATAPCVYFFKVADKRYGYLGRNDAWDADSAYMAHTESQYYESRWQVSALVLQDPYNPAYTASDLVNEVASIMQSDSTRAILNALGVGVLRVMDVTNPYFTDDRDNFEASPSFDFILVYENSRPSTNPVVSEFNGDIIGV